MGKEEGNKKQTNSSLKGIATSIDTGATARDVPIKAGISIARLKAAGLVVGSKVAAMMSSAATPQGRGGAADTVPTLQSVGALGNGLSIIPVAVAGGVLGYGTKKYGKAEAVGKEQIMGQDEANQKQTNSSVKGILSSITTGATASVLAIKTGISMIGFKTAGIAAGSKAAAMMSSAAVAQGGGVAAGTLVPTLQSFGALGFGFSIIPIAATGGALGYGTYKSINYFKNKYSTSKEKQDQ